MAPSKPSKESAGNAIKKMPRLPSNAKVTKRPIMRPAIASPYAGKQEEKIVYVSSKMPFMSAVSRVRYLLKHVDKREMQSILEAKRKKSSELGLKPHQESEPVMLKATGKAIQKALSLAMFFQKQPEYAVKITTSSVQAIDDIEVPEGDDDIDLPEARLRQTSVVERLSTFRVCAIMLKSLYSRFSRRERQEIDEAKPTPPKLEQDDSQAVPLTARQAFTPLALITVSACLQGLTAGFSVTLNKHFQDTLHLNKLASTGLQVAHACAYLFGAPTFAHFVLRRWGYRWCLIMGLTIHALGALLFWPSGRLASFPFFCVSFFIMSCGRASIDMAETPYIALCGPPRYGELRINLIQGLKATCAVASAVLASYVVFADTSNRATTTQSLMYVYLADAVLGIILAGVFFFAGRYLPGGFPETTDAALEVQAANASCSWTARPLRKQVNLWLAVASVFCDDGSGAAILAFFVNFAMKSEGITARVATQRMSVAIATVTAGRFAAALLMAYFKPRHILLVFMTIALLLQVGASIPQTGPAGTWFLISEAFFRACVHVTVFTMGLKGLGKRTRLAAGFLTAAHCGGAVFAPITGAVSDRWGVRLGQVVPTIALGIAWLYPVWLNMGPLSKEIDELSKAVRGGDEEGHSGGCAIAGSDHAAVQKALAALQPFFAQRKPCSIFGSTDKIKGDAQHAALLNGIASHVHDYDDTHLDTIIHPTGPVASALLAWAQHQNDDTNGTPISGKQLLLALITGIEVECKLGLSVWPKHYDVGWHITGTVGSVGAAVAVCKLMSMTVPGASELQQKENTMVHAIGIAATQVTGLREMFGSDTKSFHVGRAAQNGLLAALLAEKGFTSSEKTLEAHRGWCNVVCETGSFKLNSYVEELGKAGKWEIEKNTFKPFPCGIVKHPAIDAAIRMREQIVAAAGETGLLAALKKLSFMALVHPLVLELTAKREPIDGLQAKFSVFHGVAVGLLFGKAGPAQYADDVVTDADVVAVRSLINAIGRPDLQRDEALLHAMDPENPPVDGNFPYSVHVEHAIGSIAAPMNQGQLQQKFTDQVTLRVGKDAARDMSEACFAILACEDIANVLNRF
ncbi:hypothetical protein FH972_024001 [Carpinus fangiana]|uniref:Uncharacterized protein n=1 Tax=Carpinus fangiana TaxID=176857 RepID=A0A5N6KXG6_9ROSI|nr:hypothetical protein FH972_024001 [Carpinus fangiana]